MTDTIKLKDASPLVQSVIAFDRHIQELERIGAKLDELELKTDFDFQMARKLMGHFVDHGQGVSEEVIRFSDLLNESRERASAVSDKVSARAAEINGRDTELQKKMEKFGALAEKVRGINGSIASLRQPEGQTLTDEDRKSLFASLHAFDSQLDPLIEEAQNMRSEAREAKMKVLEQSADSLAQTLLSVRQKVRSLGPAPAARLDLN